MTGHKAALAAELDIHRAEHRAVMQDTASAVADRHIKAIIIIIIIILISVLFQSVTI
jgi:hypothetical protein